MYVAYARVSTKNQNEERQLIALREYLDRECDDHNSIIYTDKESGKNFDRPGYKNLIRMLRPGDIFVVESIDRLGRNYDEILEQWRIITKEKDCDIVVLDMPLLDTRKSRDLTGTLISDMVLQILSYVSQKERELLKRRQAEGVAAAKARGVKFGRTAMERPANYAQVLKQYQNGNISIRQAGCRLGVSHSTFRKWMREDMATSKGST